MKNKFSTLRSAMSDSAQSAASVKAHAMLAEMHLNSQQTEVVKQEGIANLPDASVKITNLASIS